MTTDIRIRTNGNYVAEGTISNANQDPIQFKVGPGTPAEQSFHVPHGSKTEIHIDERPATEDEVSVLKPGGPVGSFNNGEFVERNKTED